MWPISGGEFNLGKGEKIADNEFKENVRKGLSKLIGKVIKVTIGTSEKTNLKTLEGTLITVDEDTFTKRHDFGVEAQSRYNLIDVHFYFSPYDKDPTGTWPLRHRK